MTSPGIASKGLGLGVLMTVLWLTGACSAAQREQAAADESSIGAGVETRKPTPSAEPHVTGRTGMPAPDHVPAPSAAPAPSPPMLQPIAFVDDPEALRIVFDAGGRLGMLLHGLDAANNRSLAVGAAYQDIAEVLAGDIGEIKRRDANAGVGIRGNIHRLFDVRWLRAESARYELIAVNTRFDRIPMMLGPDCGEVRFLYRLAYSTQVSGQEVSSRLPMTLMVVVSAGERRKGEPGDGCAHAAKRWLAPAALRGAELGQWLVSAGGPLAPLAPLDPPEKTSGAQVFKVLEVLVNVQVVRWPSAVRPDLGGHAEYVLRVFRPDGAGRMRPAPLDNTPDIARLKKDRSLRAELRAWIAANLTGIDAGTAVMPEHFLAKKGVSVSPRGLSRRANRLFRQIFAPEELADMDAELRGMRRIASPTALLRRLDDMSCVGCHQSRTIAGFHFLGTDGDDVSPGNALAVAMSPHLIEEITRRERLIETLAAGSSGMYEREFAERGASDQGLSGSRCGLGNAGYASWTCAPGYQCERYDAPSDDADVGVCVAKGSSDVGEPCEYGAISAHADPGRDRGGTREQRSCGGAMVCNINRVGFPGGMCTASCEGAPEAGTCGVIALLEPFNSCLARKVPFPRCLAEHVAPAGLRRCDAQALCRDDYICARTPGGKPGEGACTPPYFLFQLRVDGHP